MLVGGLRSKLKLAASSPAPPPGLNGLAVLNRGYTPNIILAPVHNITASPRWVGVEYSVAAEGTGSIVKAEIGTSGRIGPDQVQTLGDDRLPLVGRKMSDARDYPAV